MKIELSRYKNKSVDKFQRLLWEVSWRVFAATTPRWMLQGWRRFLLRTFGARIGRNVQVHGGANVWFPRMLEIGENSWIGKEVNLYCVAPIKVGANAVISEGAFVCTAEHDMTSTRFELKTAPISIGDMAWVSARAIILPGRTIGEGAVVAAGAVVTHDVEPWTVVAGNPARFIKRREVCEEHSDVVTLSGKVGVLHIIPSLRPNDGGPATSVPQTAKAQRLAGMEVGMAYFDADVLTDAAYEAEAMGVKMHPFKGSHRRWNRVKFSVDLIRRLKRVVEDYDIVVIHLNWIFPTWWAAHVARSLRKPYIIMPRGCISPNAMKNGRWKKWLVGPLDRYAMAHASAVWTTSSMEAHWVKCYETNANVDIVSIGLDTSQYSAQREKPAGDKILLFMSRISAIKALDMLALAWKDVWKPGWKLLIIGPDDRGHIGKMKRFYKKTCQDGSYEFRDALYGQEKARVLSEATAFILPSRSENWSVSISEGMASGLPVICTKGAPWPIISEIGAGWRTEISVDGLKSALQEMMNKSDDELYEMGQRGVKWVKENLDWTRIGEMIKGKIESLVK